MLLPTRFLSVEVALLCGAGQGDGFCRRDGEAGSRDASQPHPAFRPADLASCFRDPQLPNLERGLGYGVGG